MTALVIGLIFGAVTLLMWTTLADVSAGRLTGGSLTAFIFTAGLVTGAFGALTEVYGDLLRASGAAERLAEHRDERVDRIVAQFGGDLLDAGAARQLA